MRSVQEGVWFRTTTLRARHSGMNEDTKQENRAAIERKHIIYVDGGKNCVNDHFYKLISLQ